MHQYEVDAQQAKRDYEAKQLELEQALELVAKLQAAAVSIQAVALEEVNRREEAIKEQATCYLQSLLDNASL